MPLQRIETVDQPRFEAAAAGQLALFEKKTKRRDDFRNTLIWGDNKLVMASLLREFKGRIDLIYIDPPFDVGADFTMDVPIGDESATVEKDQSTLEMVAYRDMWGRGSDSYLHMMSERFTLMKQLLSEHGSIYIHCDWHIGHYVKALLDEIFGVANFRNEIIWKRKGGSANPQNRLGVVTDSIFWFSKTETIVVNQQFTLASEEAKNYIEQRFTHVDEKTGRRYMDSPLVSPNPRPNLTYEYKGYPPPPNGWSISKEIMEKWDSEGRLLLPADKSKRIRRKIFLDEYVGQPVQNLWNDVYVINSQSNEYVGYETQKPESLLERIICTSTNQDDLVADFFCGSGTTGVVAERLGRRWIMADLGRFAIHTSRKRLIELQRTLHSEGKPYRAFDVFNLGRYERQWWQKQHLEGADEEHRRVVLEFFQAEILNHAPSPLIHGRKGIAFCHVDGIDSIFSRDEARQVAKAVAEAGGWECYCLAWEFEMDLRFTTAALQQELGVKLKLIQIPREIMERNRKGPPPFLEMAVLEAEPVYRKENGATTVDLKLTKFLPSLAEVPTRELEVLKERAITNGFDFIDFWAVDFDWQPGKPFNHHWQDYRTRKDRSLRTTSNAGYRYPKPGVYTALLKVVDVFGCDTSITVEVKV